MDATKKGMGCPGVFRMYFVIPKKLRSSLVLKKLWKMKMMPSFWDASTDIEMFFYDLCGAEGSVFRDTYIYIYTYVPEWSRESQ